MGVDAWGANRPGKSSGRGVFHLPGLGSGCPARAVDSPGAVYVGAHVASEGCLLSRPPAPSCRLGSLLLPLISSSNSSSSRSSDYTGPIRTCHLFVCPTDSAVQGRGGTQQKEIKNGSGTLHRLSKALEPTQDGQRQMVSGLKLPQRASQICRQLSSHQAVFLLR